MSCLTSLIIEAFSSDSECFVTVVAITNYPKIFSALMFSALSFLICSSVFFVLRQIQPSLEGKIICEKKTAKKDKWKFSVCYNKLPLSERTCLSLCCHCILERNVSPPLRYSLIGWEFVLLDKITLSK